MIWGLLLTTKFNTLLDMVYILCPSNLSRWALLYSFLPPQCFCMFFPQSRSYIANFHCPSGQFKFLHWETGRSTRQRAALCGAFMLLLLLLFFKKPLSQYYYPSLQSIFLCITWTSGDKTTTCMLLCFSFKTKNVNEWAFFSTITSVFRFNFSVGTFQ